MPYMRGKKSARRTTKYACASTMQSGLGAWAGRRHIHSVYSGSARTGSEASIATSSRRTEYAK